VGAADAARNDTTIEASRTSGAVGDRRAARRPAATDAGRFSTDTDIGSLPTIE